MKLIRIIIFFLLGVWGTLNGARADDKMNTPKYAWKNYHKHTEGKSARTTTVKALKKLKAFQEDLSSEWALDLGCGSGRDTFEILKHMNVVAMDQEKSALTAIKSHYAGAPQTFLNKLLLVEENFSSPHPAESSWEPSKYLFINASFSLPFCPPGHFEELWNRIKNSLKSQGVFAGQFFGPRHSWTNHKEKSFFSKEEILKKLKGFKVEIEEEEIDEKSVSGEMVHWHIFHVIAQKK